MVLQVSLLARQADGPWSKRPDAFASIAANARVNDAVRAGPTQVSRIGLRIGVRSRIEDLRAARLRQCGDVFELRGYSADEDTHLLHSHRITAIPRKFFEMKDCLGYGRFKLRGRVVDAEAPVAEPRSPGIEVSEQRHDVARSRSRHALVGRHERDLSNLVEGARIRELLQGEERVPHGRIGRQALEQLNRRVPRSDDAPSLRATLRSRWFCSARCRTLAMNA